jgi:indole-3-glycerol phosphate synthase
MIIDKIIEHKKKEISEMKRKFPLRLFRNKIQKSDRDFKKAITKNKINLIAEIKRASPSEGIIRKNFDVREIAKIYEKNNVAAISILTEKDFFNGNINNLQIARAVTSKPLLRKDFIIDEYQIYESRYYGANAILLIAMILTKDKLNKFIKIAGKYGMDCLVEIRTKTELNKALQSGAKIIGINNRSLKNLKVDINTTFGLVKYIPGNKIVVSESGIKTRENVESLTGKVNAVLVGTELMKSKNITKKISEMGF